MSEKLLKRRLPYYLTGVVIGLILSVLLFQLKNNLRTKYTDRVEKFADFVLQVNDEMQLRLDFEPDAHLQPGMPSEIFVGRLEDNGRWNALFHLEKDSLIVSKTKIGPFTQPGEYELRGALYYCQAIGDSDCTRRLLVAKFTITPGANAQRKIYVLPIPK